MFFYLVFITRSSLGGLITLTQLTGALAKVPDILTSLGVDFGAVSIFAFLYSRESNAKNAQLARLSREESLSNLKIRVDENRIVSVSSFRGIGRLVIISGSGSFITECFRKSLPFPDGLVERGVLVVSFVTDGEPVDLSFDESGEDDVVLAQRRKRKKKEKKKVDHGDLVDRSTISLSLDCSRSEGYGLSSSPTTAIPTAPPSRRPLQEPDGFLQEPSLLGSPFAVSLILPRCLLRLLLSEFKPFQNLFTLSFSLLSVLILLLCLLLFPMMQSRAVFVPMIQSPLKTGR